MHVLAALRAGFDILEMRRGNDGGCWSAALAGRDQVGCSCTKVTQALLFAGVEGELS